MVVDYFDNNLIWWMPYVW